MINTNKIGIAKSGIVELISEALIQLKWGGLQVNAHNVFPWSNIYGFTSSWKTTPNYQFKLVISGSMSFIASVFLIIYFGLVFLWVKIKWQNVATHICAQCFTNFISFILIHVYMYYLMHNRCTFLTIFSITRSITIACL